MTELSSVGILGTGSKVPDNVVTNFDLEKRLDTSDEWIRTRTGIRARRIAAENERPRILRLEQHGSLSTMRRSMRPISTLSLSALSPPIISCRRLLYWCRKHLAPGLARHLT